MTKRDDQRDDGSSPSEGDRPEASASAEGSPELTFKLRLLKPHRLIQNMLPSANPCDKYGNPIGRPPKRVDVRVSKASFKSALVVMDRFIKALEARQLEIEVLEEYARRGTFATDGHDQVQIYISEKHKKIEHVLTAAELREKDQYLVRRIPKWDEVPTGQLELVPGGLVDLSSDEAIQHLVEKAVADVTEGLGKSREERLARAAVQRREWEHQQAVRAEKERVNTFFKAAEALHQYRILMDYIEEVRRFGWVPADQRREGQSVEQWISWAGAQAQAVHPLGG